MKEISLTRGLVALVDDEDYEKVFSLGKWWAMKLRGIHTEGWYAARTLYHNGPTVLMHRFILSAPPELKVDHKDGNGLRNTRDNIRLCTTAQNVQNNRAIQGTSSFKGVSWNTKQGCWYSMIHHQGKFHWLGHHDSEVSAAQAYDEAAKRFFGEFAWLNFPEGSLKTALVAAGPKGKR